MGSCGDAHVMDGMGVGGRVHQQCGGAVCFAVSTGPFPQGLSTVPLPLKLRMQGEYRHASARRALPPAKLPSNVCLLRFFSLRSAPICAN